MGLIFYDCKYCANVKCSVSVSPCHSLHLFSFPVPDISTKIWKQKLILFV